MNRDYVRKTVEPQRSTNNSLVAFVPVSAVRLGSDRSTKVETT